MPHWVRAHRSNEERKSAYRQLRDAGFNTGFCRRARDWTWNHINTTIKLRDQAKDK